MMMKQIAVELDKLYEKDSAIYDPINDEIVLSLYGSDINGGIKKT